MPRKYIKKTSEEYPVSKKEFLEIQKEIHILLEEVSANIERKVFINQYQLAKKLSDVVFIQELKKPKLNKYVGKSLYEGICFHLNIYLQSVSCELALGNPVPKGEISKYIQKIVMSSEKISERMAKQIHVYFSKTEYDLGIGQSLELAEKFIKDNEFSFSIEDGELVLNLSKDELMTWVKRQLANHQ